MRLGGAAGAASGSLLLLLLLLLLFLLLLFLLLREEVSDLVGESLSLRRVDKARVPHASRVGGEEVAVVEVVVALAHDRRVGERPVVLAELKPSRREALGGERGGEGARARGGSVDPWALGAQEISNYMHTGGAPRTSWSSSWSSSWAPATCPPGPSIMHTGKAVGCPTRSTKSARRDSSATRLASGRPRPRALV